jgi:hypothetical protein
MKALQSKIPAALTALFLSSYAWAPAFAATPEQQPGAAMPSQTEKMGETCARLDKDQDGYLSISEWKALKLDAKAFKVADADQDGRLDLAECAKTVGG